MLSINGMFPCIFERQDHRVLRFRKYRDRRKLTFYFVAEKRIDFRELVRELFRCVYCDSI